MATIIVAGSVAQRPNRAGHAWVFLGYLLGFRDLGHDVVFVDRLSAEMVSPREAASPLRSSAGARWLAETMREAGLEDSYSLLLDGNETVGISRDDLRERLARSALLLDVNGFLADSDLFELAPKRVYLDIDPGFAQMWAATGLADLPDRHDAYVTVGLNVGQEECRVPTVGRSWITTLQPVLVDRWGDADDLGEGAFTSVATWRGPFEPVTYEGHTFGLRAHQFRRFAKLPRHVDAPFELALDIDPADNRDVALLRDNGWRLVDPLLAAGELDAYRGYVQRSLGEVSVAKGMYVEARSGWFSDRSACYLASGKPVLAQDTGFGSHLPVGEGLLSFANLDEAIRGMERILAEPERHSRAARAIAEERFDAGRVLAELLEKLDLV